MSEDTGNTTVTIDVDVYMAKSAVKGVVGRKKDRFDGSGQKIISEKER